MALVCKARKCFERKRTVSRPSALWEARTCQICTDCYSAVDQEKVAFIKETDRFSPICPFGARNGQICPEFLLLCCRRPLLRGNVRFRGFCYCAVDQANGRRPKALRSTPGSWKTLGNGPAKVRKRSEMVWERPENLQKRSGRAGRR